MKKLILFISLIMLIGVISCTSTTSNADISSLIVGSWKNQYLMNDVLYKHKLVFNDDKTFSAYYNFSEEEEKVLMSGYYSIDRNKSRITLTVNILEGSPTKERSSTLTFSVEENKMIIQEVMVGGNTETLVGKWNSYISDDKGYSSETIYDFDANGTITLSITTAAEWETPTTEKMSGKWEKISDSELAIIDTTKEDNPKAIISYIIIGKGMAFVYGNNLDMFIYNRVEE